MAMDGDEAREYLAGLLNKNLRVHTTDGRMFRGAFKCTDAVIHSPSPLQLPASWQGLLILTRQDQEQNIVLAQTYEYREPSMKQRAEAAEKASGGTVTLDMTSRYLGLVVVPGHHIVKMVVEQFASQMKNG
jgi:N-alpha-acetyltransferase 38, NatC auxiliary subunit